MVGRWVLLLFVREFQGRGRPGVNEETLGTSNGGGSLLGGQHHGGGVELFSSEGNFFCKVIFRLLFNTKALLCLG